MPTAAAAAAAASLELRAKKGGQRNTWDGCCAAGKDVATRRALVARAAAAAVEAGEVGRSSLARGLGFNTELEFDTIDCIFFYCRISIGD